MPPCAEPSCTSVNDPLQPETLCGFQSEINNISWFAFIADRVEPEIEFTLFNCIGTGEIQAGIYESCDFTKPCLDGFVSCTVASRISVLRPKVNLSQTYYVFVDGCSGAQCELDVRIKDLVNVELDSVDAITALSICRDSILTNDFSRGQTNSSVTKFCKASNQIYVYPREVIQLELLKQGLPNSFPRNGSTCNFFTSELLATYNWSASWGEEWNINTVNKDYVAPRFVAPDVQGDYTICLDNYFSNCQQFVDQRCLSIIVSAPEFSVPSSPTISCSRLGKDTVIFNWTEDPLYFYTIDSSGFDSSLDLNLTEGESLIVSGFAGSCLESSLKVSVNNPLLSECSTLTEELNCRPIIDLELDLIVDPPFDSLLTCIDYDTLELLIVEQGLDEESLLGNWLPANGDNVIDDGFIFIENQAFFLPNNLDSGIYEAMFSRIRDTIACEESLVVSFTIGSCDFLDRDMDGVLGIDDCDDTNPDVFPGNPEVCDSLDNNCNGMIDEDDEVFELPIITCGLSDDGNLLFSWPFNEDVIAYNISINGEVERLVFNEQAGNSFESRRIDGEVTIRVHLVSVIPFTCGDPYIEHTCFFSSTEAIKADDLPIIFPNPSSNELSIHSNQQQLHFTIYNISGVQQMEGKVSEEAIDISLLTPGLYFVKVFTSDNESSTIHRLTKL